MIGIFLVSLSLMFLILYLNLFTIGYTFFEYLGYVASKVECLGGILGIILIVGSFKKGKFR